MNKASPDAHSGPHVIVPLTGVVATAAVGTQTVWLSANFASFWYADAESEAISIGDAQRRRREITFSVAAAESYLLEWVRDEVLKRDFARLDTYFPPGERRPVTDKWKEITKALASDGLIPSAPSFAGTTWENFRRLVEFRNGLMHARASRPQTSGLSENQLPVPSMADLQILQPGWAVAVVTALIRELHTATGMKEPDWLKRDEEYLATQLKVERTGHKRRTLLMVISGPPFTKTLGGTGRCEKHGYRICASFAAQPAATR